MPASCAACGCTSRGGPGSSIHFFRFPSVKRDRQRREAWIKAVRRINEDGSPWQPSDHARLCEKHFVERSPNNSPRHPDFVPSLFVYTDVFKEKDAFQRFSRTAARTRQRDQHRPGRPAYVMAETDPDWAPSLHLGYKTSSQESRAARYRRRLNRAMGAVRHTSNHQVEVHLVTSNMDDDAEPPVPYLVEGITTEERNEKQGDAPVFFLADN
uniref:Thap domain protein n=1 Tax=Rhipicephalus appendiculatus TaxID=34631 RepID=A0A131YM32_RHIAP